jgi:hypothetical protein
MHPKAVMVAVFVLLFLAVNTRSVAQQSGATLSGAVSDASGQPLPNAKVSLKNIATGQATEVQTDASGNFTAANLAAGDYEVSASSEAGSATTKVTLAAGSQQTLKLVLTPTNLPSAPSSSKTAPSLEDLGFNTAETKGNPQQQALLDKRTHMLKIHQRLGLITAAPLIATVIISVDAGGKQTSRTSRDIHTALGAVTGDLYFTSAYFAIRAPRVPGTETRGPIRVHKALAWIHGPGMIVTPILGAMAFEQKSKGEKVHGLAAAHGPVAIVTAGAFGAALLSVSVKF